jgi:hypothetical protein
MDDFHLLLLKFVHLQTGANECDVRTNLEYNCKSIKAAIFKDIIRYTFTI